MGTKPTVVLVVPLVPAETGNGLAMRAGMLLDALATDATVHVLVVPVSGPVTEAKWARERARSVSFVPPARADSLRDHTTRQLADPDLRARFEATAPLPSRAVALPPTLATEAAALLPDGVESPAAVLAMRLYLAPLGAQLARTLGARRFAVDADDDDGALVRAFGDADEAAAWDRIAACWLPEADAVFAASAIDAAGIAAHAGIDRVSVIPNAVHIPTTVASSRRRDRLLYVGNLTYEPNIIAARVLATEVLPLVRDHRRAAKLDLVGYHGGVLDDLARLRGVRVTGAVPDVSPFYRRASVAVVPLRHGAGTRIKILEAFAHQRPVVATRVAIAGLGVEHGREVVVAETPHDIARAVVQLLAEPARASEMVERAARYVRANHSHAVVGPLVRDAVLVGSPSRRPGPA
jgi:glycosyltransferase involved in cell wall biosynthesis